MRSWGIEADEAFFLGVAPKSKFLEIFRPHIFFDDKESNLELAAKVVPSARVPLAHPARDGADRDFIDEFDDEGFRPPGP